MGERLWSSFKIHGSEQLSISLAELDGPMSSDSLERLTGGVIKKR